MNIRNASVEQLNEHSDGTLISTLGIQYVEVTPKRVVATMPVDERTCQPFGILHGGASLALIETVAGVGSYRNIDDDSVCLGAQMSCNHISSAPKGTTVTATATPIHLGRTTHIWNVDVTAPNGRLISSARFMNFIIKKK